MKLVICHKEDRHEGRSSSSLLIKQHLTVNEDIEDIRGLLQEEDDGSTRDHTSKVKGLSVITFSAERPQEKGKVKDQHKCKMNYPHRAEILRRGKHNASNTTLTHHPDDANVISSN